MPNTNPPTSNKKEFQRKLDLAENRMYCNYAFYFGATADNANDLADLKNLEGCCGLNFSQVLQQETFWLLMKKTLK